MKLIRLILILVLLLPMLVHAEETEVSASLTGFPPPPASIFAGISYPNAALKITNITSGPLFITDLYEIHYPPGFITSAGPEGHCESVALAPGDSCTVPGNFTPTVIGTNTWSFKVISFGAKGKLTYSTNLSIHPKPDHVVGGVVTQPLPSATVQNASYPVKFTFTNTTDNETVNIALSHQYDPTDFKEEASPHPCSNMLTPHDACEIVGSFTPQTTGDKSISYTLTDTADETVKVETHTHTSEVEIAGKVEQGLANNTAQGVTYPVIFTFKNMSTLHAATNLDLQSSAPNGFVITHDGCTEGGTKTTLDANSGCQVDATFTPTQIGNATIKLTLSYAGGGLPAVVATNSTVSQLAITGAVTQALPDNSVRGNPYPVVFTFTNTNANVMATGLNLTYPDHPNGFTITQDTCTEKGSKTTLDANTHCQIDGTYVPPAKGSATISANLTYAGSGAPATVSTHTTSTEVTIAGNVSMPLPENIAKGATYPVVFTFTNKSDEAATNVKPDLSLLPANFKGCTESTIPAKGSCQVSGDYTPTNDGPASLAITLTYNQGDPVNLSTKTTVSDLVLNGSTPQALPQNSVEGVSYPVILSFTNSNPNVEAKDLSLVKNYPPDFVPTHDGCTEDGTKTTLAANTSCQIEGNFIASKIGTQTVGATLKYDGDGTNPTASTTTTTALVTVNGTVTQALPNPTTVGQKYHVVFTFHNPDTVRTVTGVQFHPTFPADFTPTHNGCNTPSEKGSLAPSADCTVEGDLTPTSTSPMTVAGELTYDGDGQPATVTTSTQPEMPKVVQVQVTSTYHCVEIFNSSHQQLLPGNTTNTGIDGGSYSTACNPNKGSYFPVTTTDGKFTIIAGDPESDGCRYKAQDSAPLECTVIDATKPITIGAELAVIPDGSGCPINRSTFTGSYDNVSCHSV